MRKLLKFLAVAALLLFVGLPIAFVCLFFVMAALGVAVGIGGAVLGLVLTVLKFALIVLIPLAVLWWLATRVFARERSY